ncbi:hypothetical protein BCV70DRAFT_98529 [Testicularia cyperi]|uniref:Uncharacterized protein n=1 Tax=Testicularia cyperi TaxID=1882483 RepID=A0A317XTK0_9BASI|nr:hypothetical protein BCV70DRAFT_98529 [Testicularia cyperi]
MRCRCCPGRKNGRTSIGLAEHGQRWCVRHCRTIRQADRPPSGLRLSWSGNLSVSIAASTLCIPQQAVISHDCEWKRRRPQRQAPRVTRRAAKYRQDLGLIGCHEWDRMGHCNREGEKDASDPGSTTCGGIVERENGLVRSVEQGTRKEIRARCGAQSAGGKETTVRDSEAALTCSAVPSQLLLPLAVGLGEAGRGEYCNTPEKGKEKKNTTGNTAGQEKEGDSQDQHCTAYSSSETLSATCRPGPRRLTLLLQYYCTVSLVVLAMSLPFDDSRKRHACSQTVRVATRTEQVLCRHYSSGNELWPSQRSCPSGPCLLPSDHSGAPFSA